MPITEANGVVPQWLRIWLGMWSSYQTGFFICQSQGSVTICFLSRSATRIIHISDPTLRAYSFVSKKEKKKINNLAAFNGTNSFLSCEKPILSEEQNCRCFDNAKKLDSTAQGISSLVHYLQFPLGQEWLQVVPCNTCCHPLTSALQFPEHKWKPALNESFAASLGRKGLTSLVASATFTPALLYQTQRWKLGESHPSLYWRKWY